MVAMFVLGSIWCATLKKEERKLEHEVSGN